MAQGTLQARARLVPFHRSRRRKATIGALLATFIKRSFAWLKARRDARRAMDELMALDDRALADIGLTRGDIPYAVRHGRRHEI